MPTCVLVMGGPRAGTSLCAGILHRLGVHMGDELGEPDSIWNPLGFYEDAEFSDIYSRMCFGDGQGSMETYMPESARLEGELLKWHADAIRRRQSRGVSWGVKSARLCYTLGEFMPAKVIRMLRPESEMAASWAARAGIALDSACNVIRSSITATDRAIKEFQPELLEVWYADLLTQQDREVERVAKFVGLPVTAEAAGMILPALRRFNHA